MESDYFKDNEEELDIFLQDVYKDSFYNFNRKVVSFGTVKALSYYPVIDLTCSLTYGMSGGPVIDLQTPETLEGIALGGYEMDNANRYISSEHPAVREAYFRFVLNNQGYG
jgi:hypothetical protein